MQRTLEDQARIVMCLASGEMSLADVVTHEGLDPATVQIWVGSFLQAAPDRFDDVMKARLVARGLASEEVGTNVTGRIEEVQPLDLLQTLGVYRKPGHVLFFHAYGISQLWFEDGEIVDARSGNLEGEAAVYRIVGHEAGDFRVEVTGVSRPRAVELPGMALSLESARRLDEGKRLSSSLPDEDAVLGWASAEAASRSLGESELHLAKLFRCGATVGEVLERSPYGELETLQMVAELHQAKLLRPTGASRPVEIPTLSRRGRALRQAALEVSQRNLLPVAEDSAASKRPRRRLRASVRVGVVAAATLASGAAALAFANVDHASTHDEGADVLTAERPEPALEQAPLVVANPAPPTDTACPPEMSLLPSAELEVGRSEPRVPKAGPVHSVRVSALCIDRHEVTVADYRACFEAGDCTRAHQDGHWSHKGRVSARRKRAQKLASELCNERRDNVDDHPINCVTWEQADAYCRAQGKQLPTEAQWERAARGTSNRRHPWGDAAPTGTRVNACGQECSQSKTVYAETDRFVSTAPVESFPEGATPQGVLGLAGNVREWTADGFYPYSSEFSENPRGPAKANDRVVRGGGFATTDEVELDVAFRQRAPVGDRRPDLGFRCVQAPLE